jgi:hypothetical protein
MLLYRATRETKVRIVDFYFAPSPNIYVTRPGDPTPEERLSYPSLGLGWEQIDKPEIAQDCLLRLSACVLGVFPSMNFERMALYRFLNLEPAEFSAREQAVYERLKNFATQPAEAVGEGWFTVGRRTMSGVADRAVKDRSGKRSPKESAGG